MKQDLLYLNRRKELRAMIAAAITSINNQIVIRGSWHFKDFHLDPTSLETFSDLDLIISKDLISAQQRISIDKKINSIIKLKVSVHPTDSLSLISMNDSKVKNILEYLNVYRTTCNEKLLTYYKAKTVLLLLKNRAEEQRFQELCKIKNHSSCLNLYLIKIGVLTEIELQHLKQLVKVINDPMLSNFYSNCILSDPKQSYADTIHDMFEQCKTIDLWLKTYILKKGAQQA